MASKRKAVRTLLDIKGQPARKETEEERRKREKRERDRAQTGGFIRG